MSGPAASSPIHLRLSLLYAGALAMSGMVFPISLMLLLGQQTPALDRATLILLSQLTYLSSVGILVSKCGLDGWYLSRVAADPSSTVNYPLVVTTSVLPLAAIICLMALALGTPVAIVTCASISIALEAPSSIRSAELSGRMRYRRVVLSSWLNMPLFTTALAILSSYGPLSPWAIGGALVTANAARALVLFSGGPPCRGGSYPMLRQRVGLGVQQLLQYLMFRADALTATFLVSPHFPQLPALLFWARFQELAGGGAALGSMFLTPRMLRGKHREIFLALSVWLGGTITVSLFTCTALQDFDGTWVIAAIATFNACLALPVTLSTQRLLAAQKLKLLVFLTLEAVASGTITLLLLKFTGRMDLLPLAVSAQLVFFWLACRARERRLSQHS